MVAVFALPEDQLTAFEATFIRTVLEHRGVERRPTEAEFRAALYVLQQYDDKREDNPGAGAWEPTGDEEMVTELRAKAFMMFGATKPTRAQWRMAHGALFEPLLCESCG
jgi:hypothetical protein